MKLKWKLKNSIYIMIFMCSLLPVCIWIMFSAYDTERRIENIIINNIEAIGGSQALSIQNFCESRKESMETISRMSLVKEAILNYDTDGHSDELDTFLAANEEQKTYIASISVVDVDFNVVGSSQKYEAASVSDFQHSNEKYHSGVFAMGNTYDRETDSGMMRMIPAFIGVYDGDELIGYLIEEIACDYFDRLRLQTDFLEVGTLYLLDGDLQIITAGTADASDSREELISTPEERASYIAAWNAFDHETYSEGVITYEFRNRNYMTYFSDIAYTDWGIRITEDMDAQRKSNQNVYVLVALEGIAVVAILICVQMLLTKKLVAPFQQIVQTMKDVQDRHDYTLRTKVSGTDEVGVVAKGIDELLDYIEKEELEEKRKHREFAEKANAEAEKLQHKEFLSAAMLANMPSGYHRCLPDAENGFPFLQLGSHLEEILGWTAEEIKNDLGNCYRNLIWPEDLDVVLKYTDMVSRVGSGNAYDTSVYRMKHKDGNYRWITDATMFVDLGEESFFQGVIADITPYVEGMEEAKQLAEASSHAKTDFLSQMSHDIRTPMNAIIGFTNLAKQADDLETVMQEFIPKIEIASNQLLMIINDVLEMNSIESGKIEFHRVPCDILALTDDFMTVMQLQAEKAELKLVSDIKVSNRYISCDASRFNRVFMNLMSNAVKFTPAGGTVTISVEQQGQEKGGYASYLFKVADTGIGMSPEFVNNVFEPFERERTSTVSRVEGTGLGMAIVKSIVDATNGSITVDSVPGEGTTFTIQMKFEVVDAETVKNRKMDGTGTNMDEDIQEWKEKYKGKRILLVEDNEFNLAIAETILQNAGFEVETAEDGHIAVQKVQDAPAENYYDVVLMDVQMPTMNGYEATRAIRALEGTRSQIKIIAVTANAFESDKRDAEAAGMNGHIAKPIDVNVLYSTLYKCFET